MHPCGSVEAGDGEQGQSHSPAISPLGFWKGPDQDPSPFSILYVQPGDGKAMPSDPRRVPTLLLFHLPDLNHSW